MDMLPFRAVPGCNPAPTPHADLADPDAELRRDVHTIAVSLVRLADHLIPAPAIVVGTTYLADRLGCTTAWITELIKNGTIPAECVVPGTGHGKPWKLHRERVDAWLNSR